MSAVFTRNLTFQANDLGVGATLMFTFDKYIRGLYHDKFPSYHFRRGRSINHARDIPKPVDGSDKIVDASTHKLVNVGDKTSLTKDDNGVYRFSGVVDGEEGYLQAVNRCPLVEDMSIGFTKPNSGQEPTSVLYFKSIGNGALVNAQFTPVLRAYVTEQYQETQIIRAEVDSSCIWEKDLAALGMNTTWVVKRDKATGNYRITRA
ncbi:hypothetical protein BS17DRAFT_769099 [Gyrodon lividus]|nr:hypothetical protein BS17DRAFT_769099 [Gyrodon lividus]